MRDDGTNLRLDSDSAPQNVYSFRSAAIFRQFIKIFPTFKAEYPGCFGLGVVLHDFKKTEG